MKTLISKKLLTLLPALALAFLINSITFAKFLMLKKMKLLKAQVNGLLD
jgi:hypothetical protein